MSAPSAALRRPAVAAVSRFILTAAPVRNASMMAKLVKSSRPRIFHSPVADLPRRRIKIINPLPVPKSKSPLDDLKDLQLAILDPAGARTAMFCPPKTVSPKSKEVVHPGDIIQVRRKNAEPFSGVVMNIRKRGVDTAVLLRNQLTRVGVEMWFKIYSPNIESFDLVQKAVKRTRRAKLYYLRKPEHDVGSVQNLVAAFTRQREMLRGRQEVFKVSTKKNKRK